MMRRGQRNGVWMALGALLLCMPVAMGAQEGAAASEVRVLDIEQAVERALARNLSLRREGLALDGRRENKDTAFRAFYPQVAINGSTQFLNEAPDVVNLPGGGTFQSPQNIFSADVSAQLTISFRVINDIQVALLEYESGQITYEQAAQRLEMAVRSMFYTALLLEERIAIGEESVRIAEERAADARIRFDAGLIDEYTLLTAQVDVINTQTPVDETRNRFRDAVRQLNVLLGNEVNDPLRLRGEVRADVFGVDVQRVIGVLVSISPAVRGLEIAVDIFRKNQAIEEAAFLPNFTLGYRFSQAFERDIVTEVDQFGEADNWTTGGGFSVGLSIPVGNLLPFSNTWFRRNAAAREVERAELALQEGRRDVETQVYALAESLEQLAGSIEAKRLNIERAERAFAVAQEGYNAGLRTILEVRDAQNQLDNARLNYLNERYNYIIAQLDLMMRLGVSRDVLRRYATEGESEGAIESAPESEGDGAIESEGTR